MVGYILAKQPCLIVGLNVETVFIQIQSTLVISTSVISNNRLSRRKKSGPCYNTEIKNQVIKYCGKEEKLLLGSNFSPFPQYFQYIFLIKGVKLHSHL